MDVKCFKHPGALAMTTCTYCNKPICEACLHYHLGSVFCSRECANASSKLGSDLHAKLARVKDGPGFFTRLIQTAIMAGIVFAILQYMGWFRITDYF